MLALLPALLFGCARPAGEELIGSRFVSTHVEEAGEPRHLVDGPIEVAFEERRGGGDALRWSAGCNIIGGRFAITEDRLRPVTAGSDQDFELESTAMGCEPEQQEQDDWLTEVFATGPAWEMEDGMLVLSTPDVTIRLRRE